MIESPDVAIVQHTSGVLRVAHNVFETGSKSSKLRQSRAFLTQDLVSYLTDLVYTAVSFGVSSGDCPCVCSKTYLKTFILTDNSLLDITLSCAGKRSKV
jgi:hypothetical protein